jgi:hypothetical protein
MTSAPYHEQWVKDAVRGLLIAWLEARETVISELSIDASEGDAVDIDTGHAEENLRSMDKFWDAADNMLGSLLATQREVESYMETQIADLCSISGYRLKLTD